MSNEGGTNNVPQDTIVEGGSSAPIKIQLVGRDTNNLKVVITGGNITEGEMVEIALGGSNPVALEIISHNGGLAPNRGAAPSLKIVASGAGNFVSRAQGRSNSEETIFICDIVAAGGGN